VTRIRGAFANRAKHRTDASVESQPIDFRSRSHTTLSADYKGTAIGGPIGISPRQREFVHPGHHRPRVDPHMVARPGPTIHGTGLGRYLSSSTSALPMSAAMTMTTSSRAGKSRSGCRSSGLVTVACAADLGGVCDCAAVAAPKAASAVAR